ncbi:alpha/beta hydrolase domain-containing protein [Streptomyces sp. NPDC058256]|uniref:alpha/beta hydrolase domain-containing protein n=1 Tax=Streptomyces sp. NPDC058256 TaxID=3346408 RepID=UPI0036E9B0F9
MDPARFYGDRRRGAAERHGQVDAGPEWIYSHNEPIHEGYAWVGVSAQATGVAATETMDPVRYAALSHPGDSYSYDIYSQAVRDSAATILDGLRPRTVLANGESQSGSGRRRTTGGVGTSAWSACDSGARPSAPARPTTPGHRPVRAERWVTTGIPPARAPPPPGGHLRVRTERRRGIPPPGRRSRVGQSHRPIRHRRLTSYIPCGCSTVVDFGTARRPSRAGQNGIRVEGVGNSRSSLAP